MGGFNLASILDMIERFAGPNGGFALWGWLRSEIIQLFRYHRRVRREAFGGQMEYQGSARSNLKVGVSIKSTAIFGTAVVMIGLLATPRAQAVDAKQTTASLPSLNAPRNSTLLADQTANPAHDWQPREGYLLAQTDGDDAYDPFADYSEFEESMDEEEDINFFRNGRLLTIGFIGGYRSWTGTLNEAYSSNPTFGVFMSYFFDLRFAMQVNYQTSDHALLIPTNGSFDTIQGNVNITDVAIMFKYFFNTQNVTRGLADLSPYVIGGFSQIYRTANVSGNNQFAKDSAFAFDFGAGIEIPMMHNKMFFGAQALYQYVNWPDMGKTYYDDLGRPTNFAPYGATWCVLGILGVNF